MCAPMMAHFNPEAQAIFDCDASHSALEAMLIQIQSGVKRPIAYAMLERFHRSLKAAIRVA